MPGHFCLWKITLSNQPKILLVAETASWRLAMPQKNYSNIGHYALMI